MEDREDDPAGVARLLTALYASGVRLSELKVVFLGRFLTDDVESIGGNVGLGLQYSFGLCPSLDTYEKEF